MYLIVWLYSCLRYYYCTVTITCSELVIVLLAGQELCMKCNLTAWSGNSPSFGISIRPVFDTGIFLRWMMSAYDVIIARQKQLVTVNCILLATHVATTFAGSRSSCGRVNSRLFCLFDRCKNRWSWELVHKHYVVSYKPNVTAETCPRKMLPFDSQPRS